MTHGLCGKEGAMVFKRVLKGIGRLMLTTAVMCGVGLFLCSSEVKAAISTPTISSVTADANVKNSDGERFTITVKNEDTTNSIKVSKIEFCSDTGCTNTISEVSLSSSSITASNSLDIKVTNLQFLEGCNTLSEGIKDIAGVKVTVVNETDSSDSAYATKEVTISSAPIYKVSAEKPSLEVYGKVSFTPNYIYEVGDENRQYGYENENFTIKHDGSDYAKYYMLVKKDTGSTISFDASDPDWKEGSVEVVNGTIKSDSTKYKVAYLPKVKENKLIVTGSSKSGSTLSSTGLDIVSNSVDGDTTLTYEIGSFENESENGNKGDILGYYVKAGSGITATNMSVSSVTPTTGAFNVKMSLNDISTSGSARIKLAIKLRTSGANPIEVASVELPITLSAVTAKGFELQSDTVTLMAGETKNIQIIRGILPAGANQTLSNYDGTVRETTGTKLLNGTALSYDKATGKVSLKAAADVTSGTATVEIALTDTTNTTSLGTKSFNVKIISFDKEKTISSINKNNKNYITYNKDKGYSLDIKQLIIDNAKDSSGNSITIDKNQIIGVKVGSTSCSEGTWKPSEASLNQKVSCKINGVEIKESDGLTVSSYPMPTATYSSSNRTLSVKIPTKVATAYSDDNNIRQSKGFKLILEDSSGNTLYEYTDSKYQNVLSSSSESTVTYTVTAADIEGMITSAASNGKFSADTTSVKFKVIPMGYKQSSTSDETIKAKDEIAGKTDAVTVYKVSASGTNFTSSAAYGLDGQTVSITATPNSGYSFKQWSDGNTSNPRQVKVSASGTRSFQAVAGDRVANSTGAGGTDNSELYDDVPKTAESNSAIWLIVFMVFAVMGTTYALYLQLRAANSKHDR